MSDRDGAFAEYFTARSGAMRATAFLLCGDWHRAEDLVQTAFTKLFTHWHRVAKHESLDPYARQVLLRTFIDDGRRGWWRRERPHETPIEQAAPPDLTDDRLMLIQALGSVPPRQRAVLVLRYWEDLSIEETAAVLDCTPGTVKSQAARGLQALRALMSDLTITPPPPMQSAPVMSAGRRALRHRAALAGAGVTAVLVAVTALAVPTVLRPVSNSAPPAAVPALATPAPSQVVPPSAGGASKPVWPIDGDGQPQDDATSRSGPRYNQGKKLLQRVLAAVPDGWSTPSGTTSDGRDLQSHQAAVDGDLSGDTWSYQASAAVRKGGGTGQVLVEVHTANNGLPEDPCKLARLFWDMGGACQVRTAGEADVGVVTPGADGRLDQWAAYRHSDGVVVYVAQGRTTNSDQAGQPLTSLPFTTQQLAALAADESFHLT